ncbi:Eco57I restriction-modification methylase domain-containing protein [Fusobacterium ulcerans]|uniref:Eco57I restriction-modification methylase domain-containing protein n=1 Tax=Fusobacterium ulcerans TaxID=861 RepID=UPI0010329CA7|nr:Eco57I restriction-modification methylase domain-containing protein [Fusobacterium ulcerans]
MEKIYEYFEKKTSNYLNSKNKEYRKTFSQFFTPKDIAKIMVKDISFYNGVTEIKILEPSAGTGILILAVIEKILLEFKNIKKVYIEAIELDKELYKILEENMKYLKMNTLNKIEMNILLLNENFIELYGEVWETNDKNLFSYLNTKKEITKFDLIISNPPFKKINKNDKENKYFNDLILGQPNIYHLFIALSLKLLVPSGKYILISPKNYLGGKYTENLRKFIFNNFSLESIHLFNERNKAFGSEVLQEICIAYFINEKKDKIEISYNGKKDDSFIVNTKDIFLKNSNALIFPKNEIELKYKKKLTKGYKTLLEQGLEFKIGQIVQFRIDKEDKKIQAFSEGEVPLLLVQHITKNNINYFPLTGNKGKGKIISLNFNEKTKRKLIKNENYVILRKNVDFESENFIQAAVYKKNTLKTEYLGIDNNLAYITSADGNLSLEKAKKICSFLNSRLFKNYYKMFNNSHTINSYEINNMLFPIF